MTDAVAQQAFHRDVVVLAARLTTVLALCATIVDDILGWCNVVAAVCCSTSVSPLWHCPKRI